MDFLAGHDAAWLAALVVALLATGLAAGTLAGLLGVGGGIVIVPVLYHLFTLLGLDEAVRMHAAVGTSLATIIPTSISSARAHHARGSLDTDLLKSMAPGIVVGVVAGSIAGGWLSGAALTAIFAVVALLVAANMGLLREPLVVAEALPGGLPRAGIGAVIGGFSTLMGIGGGTLSVPILSAFRYPIRRAVGTASAIGLIISVPGTLGFVLSGVGVPARPPGSLGYANLVGFALIVPMTVLMAPQGAKLAHTVNPTRLKQLFALFLFLTALRMFADLPIWGT